MANARKGRTDPSFCVTRFTWIFLFNYHKLPQEVAVGISLLPEKKPRPRELDKRLIVESFVQIIDVYGLELTAASQALCFPPILLPQSLPGEAPRSVWPEIRYPRFQQTRTSKSHVKHQGVCRVGVREQNICGAG